MQRTHKSNSTPFPTSLVLLVLLLSLVWSSDTLGDGSVFRVDVDSTAVDPDGLSWETAFADLQQGIDAAADAGGGEVWVAEGTYTSSTDPVVTMKEMVDMYGGFAGTESVREERDWRNLRTIVDGEDMRQCAQGANSALLDGFTLRSGRASHGAGMGNETSSPILVNCTFADNTAESGGGAVFNVLYSSPTLINCVFMDNTAGGIGGAMYNSRHSSPTLTNCVFTGNVAGQTGGALYTSDSDSFSVLTNCTFSANTAKSSRVGIRNDGDSSLTFINCILWGNGRYEISGSATVSYSCIKGGFRGEGNIETDPLLINTQGGIVRPLPDSPCIDAGTDDDAPETDIFGTPRSLGNGVDMGAVEYDPDEAQGTLSVTIEPEEAITLGARWRLNDGMWRDSGDIVPVFPDNYSVSFSNVLGWVTPAVQNVTVASGESASAIAIYAEPQSITRFYVDIRNTSGTKDGTSWDTAFAAIQDGIDAAAALGGGEVWVAEGTYNEDRMSVDEVTEIDTHSLIMREGVELYGGFTGSEQSKSVRDWLANQTIISGVSATGVYADHAVIGADNATLDGFTVTGGSGAAYGGGMYNYKVSPTVTNCTFTGNAATSGAGMSNWDSSPLVTNCTFVGNEANYMGGGMYNYKGSPTVIACAFESNTAAEGGGMENMFSSATVINCTFTNNTATSNAPHGFNPGGGGMYNWYCSPSVRSCLFAGNTSRFGAGMGNYEASPTVTNCTFVQSLPGEGGPEMYSDNYYTSSQPVVTNCILWGNVNGEIHPSDNPTVTYTCVEGGYEGEGNIDADPMFLDPDGGDYRLQPNSPCIGAGAGGTDMGAFTFADVSGDDRVDASDIQYTINGALGMPAPAGADIDGDGSVTATDIQLVINAVLGL